MIEMFRMVLVPQSSRKARNPSVLSKQLFLRLIASFTGLTVEIYVGN
jgi:hypothetical protein